MMKRVGYWLLVLNLVLACAPDLPVRPEPLVDGYPEGAKVTVHFSAAGGSSMPGTKALGETPELDSLHLAVFGSSGYLKEYVKATIDHKPTYAGADTLLHFSATLTLSDKERIVHFIGNGPSTIDFGYDYEILPQLLSAGGGQAFWQMKKSVFIEGDKQDDGSYLATDATKAQFQNIPLIRNFSKIVLINQEDSNFIPDSFAVFSVPAKGSVVPFHAGKFIEDYQGYEFAELVQQYPGNLPDSTDFMWDAGGWDTLRVEADQAVYLYERPVPSDQIPPSYVIVHGTYDNPEDPVEEHKGKYYYKIDLMQEGEYYPILRNFKYQIRINKILSIGHTTAQAAAASAGSADVSADVTTSHLNDISDGEARLVVQPWMSQTFNKRQVNNNLLHVKFFDDVMSGDPNMRYSDVTCEIRPVPGEEDIIESVSIGYPVQASGTEKGWRTVTFTTKEPGAPGTPPRTQAIRISGSYKTETGETRTLYRDVLITLQPLQQFQLSVDSPEDEGQGVPRGTALTVRLNVGIPTGLVASMFPLSFIIEPEDMSLTPDNQVPNNNLPVSAGTSISDHAGYAGKRAFQFLRSLTYDEYLTLPQSLDLDGEPIRTFTCHFKTTRNDNATTFWVANEFFSKSRVSYVNPPVRNLRYFYVESREENIDQSVVRLQFSGKVEYLKNEDGWATYTTNSELRMKNGDRIYFRGNVTNWGGDGHFTVQGRVNVGGNIASLYRGDFSEEDDLPADYGKDSDGKSWNFQQFFMGETGVVDASALVLPMETMRGSGYLSMFQGCTNLIAAPELPATTLADKCYQSMFQGCTSLSKAPKLLAETLPQYCYNGMFSGCSSLSEITMTATAISNNNSLSNWVSGVAATGDFYGHVDKPTLPSGNNGIPTGWVDRNEFYVKATADGTLSFTGSGLQYSKNWDDWTSDGIGSISVAADDIVRFRGVRSDGTISSTAAFDVAGNILSLAGVDYTQKTTGSFTGLFKNATNLVSAARLVLPTELQADCFKELFSGCTSLTAPPALPATSLAPGCYQSMFQGCTALTSAPDLPADILVENCYDNMFNNCSLLSYVGCPATTHLGVNYTTNWLANVAASGVFVKNVYAEWPSGPNGIPVGWKIPSWGGFYVEAIETCTVWLKNTKNSSAKIYSSFDGVNWSDYTAGTSIVVDPGRRLYFKSNLSNWEGTDQNPAFSCSGGKFNVGGNITALVVGDEYEQTGASQTGVNLVNLFKNHPNLIHASQLVIPMTTIGNGGTLKSMFEGCTSLLDAPELPAMTLSTTCYRNMFRNCTSLERAPELPALTLTNGCYQRMFDGCSSLIYVKMMATSSYSQGYFMANGENGWMAGVPASGTFEYNSNNTYINNYPTTAAGIPSGWTRTPVTP